MTSKFHPQYRAVFLYRLDTPPTAVQAALQRLEGTLDEAKMVHLNVIAGLAKDCYSRGASISTKSDRGNDF